MREVFALVLVFALFAAVGARWDRVGRPRP